METLTIPQDIFIQEGQPIPFEKIAIRVYSTDAPSGRSRITLTKNLFSFLLEGEKTVHYSGKTIRIDPSQFLLLGGSNCLMSEKVSTNGLYSSLLLFFDDTVLADFFLKYGHTIRRTGVQREAGIRNGTGVRSEAGIRSGTGVQREAEVRSGRAKEPVVCFEKDAFIRNYLHSLRLLLASENSIPPALQLLKFEELMLWLAEKYPESLLSFQTGSPADLSDQQLINTVESNLHNHISVEDLAFLCNTSLSTFKRRFARLYGGISPNKWILQKRMELAAELLQFHHEKPSEVAYKVGYENHSSFTHSFKQVFGQTPSEFQQEKNSYPARQKPGSLKLDVYQ